MDGVRSTVLGRYMHVLKQYMHVQKPGRDSKAQRQTPLRTGPHRNEHNFQQHFSCHLRELRWMVDALFGAFSYDVTEILYFCHIWKRSFKPTFTYLFIYILCLYLHFTRTLHISHMLRLWSENGSLHLIGRENEALRQKPGISSSNHSIHLVWLNIQTPLPPRRGFWRAGVMFLYCLLCKPLVITNTWPVNTTGRNTEQSKHVSSATH